MQRVIAVLTTRMSDWGMAFWFESSKGGKLPKDVISCDPDATVKAAQAWPHDSTAERGKHSTPS